MSAPTLSTPAKTEVSQVSPELNNVELPRSVITAAAQFASRDNAKFMLQCIHIYYVASENKTFVSSTDGHRLFRCKLPGQLVQEPLLIYSKDLRKLSGKADQIVFSPIMARNANLEGNDQSNFHISASYVNSFTGEVHNTIYVEDWRYKGSFPNTDQLFPEANGVKDKDVFYNANYLLDFAKVAAKFSDKGLIRQTLSAPTTPNLFECEVDIGEREPAVFEYLLMPVQQRQR